MTIQAPLLPLAALAQETQAAPVTAQEGAPAEGSEAPSAPFGGGMLVPMVLIMVVFYFVLIGPERKQRKKREEMLKTLVKGDKVMTSGGMFASVAAVADDVVTLQIADGVRARFSRSSIQTVIRDEVPADAKDAGKKA
jgi:preprotein translocase subunit YajC